MPLTLPLFQERVVTDEELDARRRWKRAHTKLTNAKTGLLGHAVSTAFLADLEAAEQQAYREFCDLYTPA